MIDRVAASYRAKVRLVYLDAPLEAILRRNRERQNVVPEKVIYNLMDTLEVPDMTEAHQVQWVY